MALSDDLVAYWNFDENSGTTAEDSTASNFDLTGSGTPGWTASGKISNATDLDSASSEYWSRASGDLFPAYNTAFSINFWFKPETVNAIQFLVSKSPSASVNYQRYSIRVNNGTNGKIEFLIHESDGTQRTATASANMSAGTWYMITAIYDGSTTMTVYLNNANSGTDEVGSFRNDGESPFYIGRAAYSTANYANGIIDEFGFWIGKALSSAERTELYNSGDGLAYPFTSNVTVSPSTLTLSTTNQSPSYFIDVTSGPVSMTASVLAPGILGIQKTVNPNAVTLSASVLDPTIFIPTPAIIIYPITISLGLQVLPLNWDNRVFWTSGERGIETSYPNESGLIAETTKQTGRISNLIYKKSFVSSRNKAGL